MKVALIDKRTDYLQACQLPLGHSNLQCIVRFLGIEVDVSLTHWASAARDNRPLMKGSGIGQLVRTKAGALRRLQ